MSLLLNRYEIELGLRYVRAKRRNNFISIISLISMLGIALGVAALIVVMSVMNGFQTELRERMLVTTSHVTVRGLDAPLADWQAVSPQLTKNLAVAALSPFVQSEGGWSSGKITLPSLVQGIAPATEQQVGTLASYMKTGSLESLKPGEWGAILGSELAKGLGVNVGDKVTLITAQVTVTPAGSVPRVKSFTVTGIFEIGAIQADNFFSFIHLNDAQRLFQLGDSITGLRVRLHDPLAAPQIADEWIRTLPPGLGVSEWTRTNANFFKAIELQKRGMFIILTLIVAVAAFNLVSTLVMAVQDKESDIAILRTLGAKPFSIMQVFVVQGAIIGVIGTAMGLLVGVLIATNVDTALNAIERLSSVTLLDKSVYQLSQLPSKILASDLIAVVGLSLLLSLVATLYPSWSASRTRPADALRYD
jgi:lipoprotein-releasing system permease protein